jgi:hypothetical protein
VRSQCALFCFSFCSSGVFELGISSGGDDSLSRRIETMSPCSLFPFNRRAQLCLQFMSFSWLRVAFIAM